MNKVNLLRWISLPPRTISSSTFKSVVEELDSFMPGLKTSSRLLKSGVHTDEGRSYANGTSCWNVYQSFSFQKIEHLEVKLLLNKTPKESCEIYIEFGKYRIFLSVSDAGTGWKDAVFEEIERKLKIHGIFKSELINKLYGTIIKLQNCFLIVGLFFFMFPSKTIMDLTYFSISLIFLGLIPLLSDIFRIYFPSKPIFIIDEKIQLPTVTLEKSALWLGVASSIVTLITAIY